jgi:hypothetical protein
VEPAPTLKQYPSIAIRFILFVDGLGTVYSVVKVVDPEIMAIVITEYHIDTVLDVVPPCPIDSSFSFVHEFPLLSLNVVWYVVAPVDVPAPSNRDVPCTIIAQYPTGTFRVHSELLVTHVVSSGSSCSAPRNPPTGFQAPTTPPARLPYKY